MKFKRSDDMEAVAFLPVYGRARELDDAVIKPPVVRRESRSRHPALRLLQSWFRYNWVFIA